jgi:hypothetical protein
MLLSSLCPKQNHIQKSFGVSAAMGSNHPAPPPNPVSTPLAQLQLGGIRNFP